MTLQEALNLVIENKDLTQDQATAIAGVIMRGEATQAQIGGFLVALRMKGETVDEIAGFVRAMRENAIPCPMTVPVIDIVGTGGDHAGTFNISTTTAFVVAGAGGAVAKHGNRGVSSKSGAADVLSQLGVSLELTPAEVAKCVEKNGRRLPVRPVVPPGHAPCGPRAQGNGRPHHLQPARPHDQPRRHEAPRDRRVRQALVPSLGRSPRQARHRARLDRLRQRSRRDHRHESHLGRRMDRHRSARIRDFPPRRGPAAGPGLRTQGRRSGRERHHPARRPLRQREGRQAHHRRDERRCPRWSSSERPPRSTRASPWPRSPSIRARPSKALESLVALCKEMRP